MLSVQEAQSNVPQILNNGNQQKNFHDISEIIDDDIGSGNFATVIKAYHRVTKRLVAVKRFNTTVIGQETQEILDEGILLKSLKHQNIVRYKGMFEPTVIDPCAYIVMELMDCTMNEVLDSLGCMTEVEAAMIIAQIA